LLHAHRVALEAGNNHLSYICYASYIDLALIAGTSLTRLKEKLEEAEKIIENNIIISCEHQVTLNFLGIGNQNSHLPIGEFFDVEKFNPEHVHGSECCFIYLQCIMLAYFFHELDAAREMVDKCRKYLHFGKIFYS